MIITSVLEALELSDISESLKTLRLLHKSKLIEKYNLTLIYTLVTWTIAFSIDDLARCYIPDKAASLATQEY